VAGGLCFLSPNILASAYFFFFFYGVEVLMVSLCDLL
jgi:hypothetical protein